MKKIICILSVLILTFSLFGCKKDKTEENYSNDIVAVTPSDGQEVYLTNDVMTDWIKNYEPTSSEQFAEQTKMKDLYFMKESITLSWSDKKACEYYVLFVDMNSDFSSAESYMTTKSEKNLSDLFVNTEYFWKVVGYKNGEKATVSKTFKFVTASTPRTIVIEGVSNTRDIGGYDSLFGKKVKQGLVFRCARPENITALGQQQATEKYGIKTELDLRGGYPFVSGISSEEEICRENLENGSPFGKSVKYVYYWAPTYVGGNYGLNNNIISKTHLANENDRQFVRYMKLFADEANYPIIFHCAGGRDRTGTLACILNALLGVDEQDLYIDYETTYLSKLGTEDSPVIPSKVTDFETILDYLNAFDGENLAEKAENYLLTFGMTKDEINSIRNIMLEK